LSNDRVVETTFEPYNGEMSEVTKILAAVGNGDPNATAHLLPLVYQELRCLARSRMAQERPEHTLQATALVHEAFLRLIGDEESCWDSRNHFFAAAAEAMRRILIEHARRKHALKHGGHLRRVELDDDVTLIASPCDNVEDLLALDEALDQLGKEDQSKAELVKLLYFAGLNLDEAADVQGISRTTAYRHWLFARAWLHDAIAGHCRSRTE
jgi:RNA polymerase sigma factor (TIGR02999 family)